MAPHLDDSERGSKCDGILRNPTWKPETDDDYAVLAIRNLVFDMTMQNGGGHGGSAVGMAAIGVALWKYAMRYNPNDSNWFDRDRFVLSNGHASMFLYAMNYLVGYDAWTMDELKGYGSAKLNGFTTLSHAHPEIECPAVEVTTGPLGQGIATAVGLAIASKNLAANFNKPDIEILQSQIYCMTGDGCLMEGVALEAISLAGSLQLDNLVLLYDNNQVTCDGPLDWINTEDTNAKMRASGWEVIDVYDGTYDVEAIVAALHLARVCRGKPVFINIRTVIGTDTAFAGTAKAHHGSFDRESIARSKVLAGIDPESTHVVPPDMLEFFRERKTYGSRQQQEWNDRLTRYKLKYPLDGERLAARIEGSFGNWVATLDGLDSAKFQGLATRESNGEILELLWQANPALCGGGADLVNSNKFKYSAADVFHPATAAPAVRMGALSNLQVIHIGTHDSFQEGQNGPTHQPVELDSLFRAMPNLTYIRPCDAEELIGAYQYALEERHSPSFISIARDAVGPVPSTSREHTAKGAYVICERLGANVTLVSCGSELHYVVAAAEILKQRGITSRIVSAPSLDIFSKQSKEYQDSVFLINRSPIVSAEEYVPLAWSRYATASIGMKSFGYSASRESNYDRFGLDAISIADKVALYLKKLDGRDARQQAWALL
ncbi:hypothetical protein PCG10_006255 [Penicillium crustosum]|uniref:Transketolase-like pyrimidine-binding domain-containing protein n=1 Tax=Penicillium crustosum TaxID=36656 RepID=A0A9P5GI47_PENCR|nr:hypothetical protein PCG10_006255 [Penicillium crustosum]